MEQHRVHEPDHLDPDQALVLARVVVVVLVVVLVLVRRLPGRVLLLLLLLMLLLGARPDRRADGGHGGEQVGAQLVERVFARRLVDHALQRVGEVAAQVPPAVASRLEDVGGWGGESTLVGWLMRFSW